MRSTAWAALGAVLGIGALLLHTVDPRLLDWQPALAFTQPWRAFSAVFVHYSSLHLAANLAGAALTAALGVAARLPARAAAAWLLAWPLTQFGLLAQPALAHYGGLSGVLHAGVAVAGLQLLLADPAAAADAPAAPAAQTTAQRRLGAAILAVLALKIGLEAPWGSTLAHPPGWDIAVAPGAHLSGVAAGLLAAAGVQALHVWRSRTLRPRPAA